MKPRITPAATELGKIVQEFKSKAAAAREIGVSQQVLVDYLEGRKRPKNLRRVAIERWSRRRVRAADWEYPEERAELSKVHAYSRNRQHAEE